MFYSSPKEWSHELSWKIFKSIVRASFVFQSQKSWKMLHAECLFFIKRNKKSQNFLEEVFRPQVLCFVGAMGELVGIFFYYSKIKILIRKKTTIFNFSVLSDHKRADQRRMSVESPHTTIHVYNTFSLYVLFLFSHDHWRFIFFSLFLFIRLHTLLSTFMNASSQPDEKQFVFKIFSHMSIQTGDKNGSSISIWFGWENKHIVCMCKAQVNFCEWSSQL